jgi:putative peptidoglycan lipid II flippase
MKKMALILMVLTILGKIFGLARDLTLSYFYGTSNISDAYFISLSIPFVIFVLLGNGISTAYIPLYSKIENERGDGQSLQYTNNLLHILMLLCTLFVGIGFLFTKPIVFLFASGFDAETMNLTVQFTRVSLLGIYFTALIYVCKSYLQIKGSFVIPGLISLPLNTIIVASIFISAKTDVMVLAYGTLIATISQLLMMVPSVIKSGYRYQFSFDLRDPHIKTMALIALPVMLGVSVNQINALVDNTLASNIVEGGVSALNYAFKLNGFIQGIFVASIMTVMFPMISKMAAENNLESLKSYVSEALVGIKLLVIPATVGAVVFAEEIVALLFGRGAFDAKALMLTSQALLFYSIGMLGFGMRDILARAFYAMHDTKTPVINSVLAVLLNIVLSVSLSPFLGIGGLALATSISALFCTFLLWGSLRRKIGDLHLRRVLLTFLKIIGASLVMGAVAKVMFHGLIDPLSQNAAVAVAIACGAGLYFVIIRHANIPEVDLISKQLREKLWKRGKTGA